MVVEGIDLATKSDRQAEFKKALLDLAKPSPGCDFIMKFSPINRIRLRRALAIGTRVAVKLGFEDESAAQVMRDAQFESKFGQALKGISKAFEAVVVRDFQVEFITGPPTKVIGPDDPDDEIPLGHVILIIASIVVVLTTVVVIVLIVRNK